MRTFVLAGIFALAASSSLAQTDAAPEPVNPGNGAPETAASADPAATAARFWLEYPMPANRLASAVCWLRQRN